MVASVIEFNVNTVYVQTILKGLDQVQEIAASNAGANVEELTEFLKNANFVKPAASISSTLSRLYKYGYVDRIKDSSGGRRYLYICRIKKHSSLRELDKRIVPSKEERLANAVIESEVKEQKSVLDINSFIELIEEHEKYKATLTQIAEILKELGI